MIRGRSSGIILALAVIVIHGLIALGEEKVLRARYGLGGHWLVYEQRYSYIGIAGRTELAVGRGAALLELGLVHKPGDDDVIVLADGAAIFYFDSGEGKVYLGLGLGLIRWEDTTSWDKGVWYQNFSKFIVGREFSFQDRRAFFQMNITFSSWFNPIISTGIWF